MYETSGLCKVRDDDHQNNGRHTADSVCYSSGSDLRGLGGLLLWAEQFVFLLGTEWAVRLQRMVHAQVSVLGCGNGDQGCGSALLARCAVRAAIVTTLSVMILVVRVLFVDHASASNFGSFRGRQSSRCRCPLSVLGRSLPVRRREHANFKHVGVVGIPEFIPSVVPPFFLLARG